MVLEIWRAPSHLETGEHFPVFKKGIKGNSGKYRPISLTSVPSKIMEKIILGAIEKHLKDNLVIDHSQHGFMRGKSCFSNLISFHDKVTHLVDPEKPVDVIFFNFSKAFDTICHRILLDEKPSPQLDKHIMGWVSNGLMSQAQRMG
ncbi:RNA-directed DNA polymerase from mobile element jockey-like protein [Turdus rufiventris]|nr:RNA-directed DNA polymerase from mobile element jockey-like protein [Turdus rufiventris]